LIPLESKLRFPYAGEQRNLATDQGN